MKTKLSHIAEIKTGIFAKPGLDGEVVYLQARHFDEFGDLNSKPDGDLALDRITEKHLLRKGDVLFAAKGWKNFATVYRSDFPAVASTTFFVLRARESMMLPEYLVWLLNSAATQSFLKHYAVGSAIASISKSMLDDFQVDVPSLEKQRQILEISKLSELENNLRLRIAELRQRQIQQQINKAIK